MAVLSAVSPGVFPGADRVLAAQAAALPQPDQLCGPFAAYAALHAVLPSPPSMVDLARAAGTSIWPYDVSGWRPAGAPWDRTGWDELPVAASEGGSGTDAAGLAIAVATLTRGAVEVVPVAGAGADVERVRALLAAVAGAAYPLGVVANVRTGALDPDAGFDVGHFVILWAYDGVHDLVSVADSYAELGTPGQPSGCREVDLSALVAAISAPPGRGLLLLARRSEADAARELVRAAGLSADLWST